MLVQLSDGKSSNNQININEDRDATNFGLEWDKHKKWLCWNLKIADTRLPAPFHKVFLKRWLDKKAPAHELLIEVVGKSIPGTPRIFGTANLGMDYLYVSELWDGFITLHEQLKNCLDLETIINCQVANHLIEQAISCFEALGPYRYVYTDFCNKNILVSPSIKNAFLIDLDSAWSDQYLSYQKGVPDGSFTSYYWSLWIDYVVGRGRPQSPMVLQQSMILSFAAVWGRALGLLKNQRGDEAFDIVIEPLGSKLDPLWNALDDQGDRKEFREYFLLASDVKDLFDRWQGVFRAVISGSPAQWAEVRQTALALIALHAPPVPQPSKNPIITSVQTQRRRQVQVQATKKKLALKSRMMDVGKGILVGAIDPFGLLRKSGVLKRGPFGS